MNTIQKLHTQDDIMDGFTNGVEASCLIRSGEKISYKLNPPCKRNGQDHYSITVNYSASSQSIDKNSVCLKGVSKRQVLDFFKLLIINSVTPCTLQDVSSDYFRVV